MTDTLKQFIASFLVALFVGGCSTNVERGGTTGVRPTSVAETALSKKLALRLVNSQGEHFEYFIDCVSSQIKKGSGRRLAMKIIKQFC